jgi:hypothetical protein
LSDPNVPVGGGGGGGGGDSPAMPKFDHSVMAQVKFESKV